MGPGEESHRRRACPACFNHWKQWAAFVGRRRNKSKAESHQKKHLGRTRKKKKIHSHLSTRARPDVEVRPAKLSGKSSPDDSPWIRVVPRVTGACDGENTCSLLAHGGDVRFRSQTCRVPLFGMISASRCDVVTQLSPPAILSLDQETELSNCCTAPWMLACALMSQGIDETPRSTRVLGI